MNSVWKVAQQFSPDRQVIDVNEHGNGNINDTYLVTVGKGDQDKFILQRINTHVFKQPNLIIQNLQTYTEHVHQKLATESDQPRQWDVPYILYTGEKENYFIDEEEGFWRAISFVNHSSSYETVQSEEHAREAGHALGTFHRLVSDLNIEKMHDTLLGFHIVPHYLQQYDRVMDDGPQGSDSAEVQYGHQMIAARRDWAAVLENAREQGELNLQTIHGDPKINNFMISDDTGQAISLIDLDTVKPGLVHYDIGDCLRSSCNPLGEDTLEFDQIHFETDLAHAILDGYLSAANKILTENDYAYFFDAIRLITFEMGLRFFQDYLAGNVYFKVKHPEHNLERAIVQFKLTESIESQEKVIRKIIEDFRAIS